MPRGFALLSALMMMALLMLLAIGLLSLSSITLRAGEKERLTCIARANARMALIMAVGDLQKELGPDQRITATSNILEAKDATLQHPYLTGVWNSRDYTGKNPILESETPNPDYDRDQPFRRWLISSSDPQAVTGTRFATNGSLQDPVELVGARTPASAAKTSSSSIPAVEAGRIQVHGASARDMGKFAWWVGDENCKGFINPSASERQQKGATVGDVLASAKTPGAYGMQAVDKDFPANTADAAKVVTHAQAALASPQGRATTAAWFHDLSPFPRSVLTNVTKGELRQDLSLFLEQQSLDNMPAWPSTTVGVLPKGPLGPNGKIALSSLDDEAGVKGYDVLPWKQLAAWWRLRKKVEMGADGRPFLWARNGNGAMDDYQNPRWNAGTLRPAPVPIRYLMFCSFGTVENPVGVFNLRFYNYPAVVLWNPYNVDLKVDEFNAHFNRLPLKYEVTKTDASGAKTVSLYDWHELAADEPNYSLAQTLRAGETMIFTPKQWARSNSVIYYTMAATPIVFTRKTGVDGGWGGGWTIGTGGEMGAGGEWGAGVNQYDLPTNIKGASGDQIEIKPVLRSFVAGTATGNSSYAVRSHHVRSFMNASGAWQSFLWHSLINWNFENNPNTWSPAANLTAIKDTFGAVKNAPRPFMVVDMKLKTLDEGEIPNKTWSQCIPGHAFQGFTDVAGNAPIFANGYKMEFISTTDPAQYLQVGVSNPLQTFFGTSNSVEDGQPRISDVEIPMAPLTSLAQLQNLPQGSMDNLYSSGFYFQNHAIGNSFASPGVPSNAIKSAGWKFWMEVWLSGGAAGSGNLKGERKQGTPNQFQIRPNIDRSYAANHLLWDDYFFSSLASNDQNKLGSGATLETTARNFYLHDKPLPNERYKPYFSKPAEQIVADLAAGQYAKADSWKKAAGALMVDGGFNVNSVSVDAWKALLASANHRPMAVMNSTGGKAQLSSEGKFIVSRFAMPNGPSADATVGKASEDLRWIGYRELKEEQIDALAQAIVRQVKARGPFRSLGDFINRRLGAESDPLTRYGALQAALEDKEVDINAAYRGSNIDAAFLTQKGVNYPNLTAATGSKFQGAPCYVTQADLLGPIAPILNARSDTFVIRAYGEATGADGQPAARAWCEAVVQRVPDFMDATDAPEIAASQLKAPLNKLFGRRMDIISFRWLAPHEI